MPDIETLPDAFAVNSKLEFEEVVDILLSLIFSPSNTMCPNPPWNMFTSAFDGPEIVDPMIDKSPVDPPPPPALLTQLKIPEPFVCKTCPLAPSVLGYFNPDIETLPVPFPVSAKSVFAVFDVIAESVILTVSKRTYPVPFGDIKIFPLDVETIDLLLTSRLPPS